MEILEDILEITHIEKAQDQKIIYLILLQIPNEIHNFQTENDAK